VFYLLLTIITSGDGAVVLPVEVWVAEIIGAAIVMAAGLIATAYAQQAMGAAGMGIIGEKPERFGQVLFFFVVPATLWIAGFVLGIIILMNVF